MDKSARRVLVVEDDVLLASLVGNSLEAAGFLAELAHDAASARKKASSFDPDLVLLDLGLGEGPSGVHLARALHKSRPDIAILVLTKFADTKSLSAEAAELPDSVGFIRKQFLREPGQLVAAIEKVLHDKPDDVRHDREVGRPFPGLPDRGIIVLRYLAEGCSNQEIASRVGITSKSVERWTERIYAELGIQVTPAINPRVAAVTRYLKETGAMGQG
jgi:DNA-binding NarL/FixJ family response regulator